MGKLSIVVTIYKNQDNIIPFYNDFKANIMPYIDDYEIVMVNDASPDKSWQIMKRLAMENSKIKLINLSRNFGAVAASFTGIQYSTGDCVTIKAVDLQEPASLTIDMYNKWKQGAASIIAVREARNDSWLTNKFSNLYYWLVRKLVVSEMPQGGFDTYLIDKDVAKIIVQIQDHNSPITLQLLWLGFGPEKVYYERKKREIGKSSWTFSKKAKLFIDTFIGFSYVPIRIMSVVGICLSLVSALWAVWLLFARLYGKIVVQGYTTIVILVLGFSGLIMFMLGLLGEYMWRTLDACRRRPISIVAETVNYNKE